MAMNKGYLTCGRTKESDECMTPFYAVEPLLEFVPKGNKIWCPFDEEWSAFVNLFRENGYSVVCSHIKNGEDFFEFEPSEYDVIISNPPFSLKDKVIERLYTLNKPFAILLPIQSLQSNERYKYWSQGLELLCFNERIGYHTNGNFKNTAEGNHFASAYFCRNVLPERLMFRKLKKYQRELK